MQRTDYFMYIAGALGLIAAVALPQSPGSILVVCSTLTMSLPFIVSGLKLRGVQDERLALQDSRMVDLNERVTKLELDVNNLKLGRKMEQL